MVNGHGYVHSSSSLIFFSQTHLYCGESWYNIATPTHSGNLDLAFLSIHGVQYLLLTQYSVFIFLVYPFEDFCEVSCHPRDEEEKCAKVPLQDEKPPQTDGSQLTSFFHYFLSSH
jgi:hypothetical protein